MHTCTILFTNYEINSFSIRAAAQTGNLEMVKYLHHQGCELDEKTSSFAAASGNLKLLVWLHEDANCPWSSETCSQAAAYGFLELLKYARSKGCDWWVKFFYI